ncbi:DUF6132 family protein [Acidiluteibacter ferrifornacis]|uniref:YtxH domain-containing protein n=1 Tax=Acidiluteibacter ferrifornacis TaxID=2692424 RepID=A0A6N9NIB8_9FLAO|nr:DUF6132 family protein [Acidiluteibacter ferrifornacis]NBG65574.1 hypothetical protein [Acidiluteibacter ferrifornacis]
MNFIKKHILIIVGLVFGGIVGYFYYLKIGCNSGSCNITSNPINSTVYGSIMGALIFSLFQTKTKEK